MLKKLCIISILFLLSACSHRHYWLEVGQSYKADFSGKYELYYDIYFENKCDELTRIKIYAYISICGLLWSNWCEYKRDLGVEFGEYSIRQYRFAKEYYQIVVDSLGEVGYKWQQ